ncbi:MAG TPA: DUF2934 domain-containing protein [Burkholderiales bacterium]|jgi:hypothetical protein|nr:DUF2934 domain-containing protein [Burkholderiales bacterium]
MSKTKRSGNKAPDTPKSEPQAMAGDGATRLTEDERRRMVAEAAYYRALQRGFAAGGEVDDWLAAEREINDQFAAAGNHIVARNAAPARAKGKAASARSAARSVQ